MEERETERQQRWLVYFRLMTLGVAAFMLPSMVTLTRAHAPLLIAAVLVLLTYWSAPFWSRLWRHELAMGACLLAEGLGIAALVSVVGGISSPLALLLLPVVAQASILLRPWAYLGLAAAVIAAYALAVRADLDPAYMPVWTPVIGMAIVMGAVWLGIAGATVRRERLRADHELKQLRTYRGLVERLPVTHEDESFWRLFLPHIRRVGDFQSAAVIRWEGPRPRLLATDREKAWRGLLNRHEAVFRQGPMLTGRPELFSENPAADHPQGRSIVCWPIPGRTGGEGAAGVLCVMATESLTVGEAGKRLAKWLPLATLAMALSTPKLTLQRTPVDWQVLVNVTLHRLHKRLAHYMVLLDVEPGRIEADALLLADAIAHLVEEALDRTPPSSRVRLSVRRQEDGWHFEVETASPPTGASKQGRPELMLARQVVAAHGGAWSASEGPHAYKVGFVLPATDNAG